MIHSRLLQYSLSPYWPDQEKSCLELDSPMSICITLIEVTISVQTHSPSPWPLFPFHHHYQCIQVCLWCHAPPNRCQWWMAPLLIPLPIILFCWEKLWYLWQGTPHNHLSPKILEIIPSWFSIPYPGLHWSWKPHILPQSPITELKISSLAFEPWWLWP